jgi:hypothetical protein
VERATAEMKDNKATGDDDVSGDLAKLFREDVLSTVIQQLNNIRVYETGEWPKNFSEVTVIALKKKPRATKCSDRHTITLITNTAIMVASLLGLSFERKIEEALGKNQSGFRRGKGASDTIGMLRIISERTWT